MPQAGLERRVGELLDEVHRSLFERALAFQKEHTHDPATYEAFQQVVQDGWALSWWCGDPECEAVVKDETKATTRNIPLEQSGGQGTCIHCGRPASERALWARAY